MAAEVALVTGASSGIGEAFARQLAAKGKALVLVARRGDRLEALAGEIRNASGVDVRVIAKDLSLPNSRRDLFEETERLGLAVAWLVNNAGFGTCGTFAGLPLDREIEEIRLNVEALAELSHRYLPGMIARRHGVIVNLGSTGSFVPVPYMATYAATKAFVLSFSEALAAEVSSSGVQVLALCPGATRTEFQAVAGVRHATDRLPGLAFMTADEVVAQAIKAAEAGRRTLVPGILNALTVESVRLMPRRIVTAVTGGIFQPRSA
jgi:hypothetical protein